MKIERHKPVARGVNQLMYVGDDQAVESASSTWSLPMTIAAIAAAAWLLWGRR